MSDVLPAQVQWPDGILIGYRSICDHTSPACPGYPHLRSPITSPKSFNSKYYILQAPRTVKCSRCWKNLTWWCDHFATIGFSYKSHVLLYWCSYGHVDCSMRYKTWRRNECAAWMRNKCNVSNVVNDCNAWTDINATKQ